MSVNIGRVMGSKFHFVTAIPLAAVGLDLDVAINTATGDIYTKASGAWSFSFNIMGPAGPAGAAGAAWIASVGVPTGGNDGDFGLNTANGDVYQKVSGTWGFLMNIMGNVITIDPTMPSSPASGDVYVNPFSSRVYGYTSSWVEKYPIGQLKRYALPNGTGLFVGPGFTGAFAGGGTVTNGTNSVGPILNLSVMTAQHGVQTECKFISNGIIDIQFDLRQISSTSTSVFWFGLFEDWPDATANGGYAHIAMRYSRLAGDTKFRLSVANETGTTHATANTGVTVANGTDYRVHLRWNATAKTLTSLIMDQDFTVLDTTTLTLTVGQNGPDAATELYLLAHLQDSSGPASMGLYKIGINK
jgi:hypothetical protein